MVEEEERLRREHEQDAAAVSTNSSNSTHPLIHCFVNGDCGIGCLLDTAMPCT